MPDEDVIADAVWLPPDAGTKLVASDGKSHLLTGLLCPLLVGRESCALMFVSQH